MPRTHGHRNAPLEHKPSDFVTSKPSQGQALTRQPKAPARQEDGTARQAPKGPPQHKV